jgi:predicted RND superfamily exporter protein
MHTVATWIVKLRFLLLGIALLALLPALKVLPTLTTNNNVDAFLAEGDPGLGFYREITDVFGSDHIVYVAVEAEDGQIWTPAELARLDRLTRTAEGVEGVEEALSLTSTDAVQGSPGMVTVGPLMEALPEDEAAVAALRAQVEGSPLLRRLVAPDGGAALIAVEMHEGLVRDPGAETDAVYTLRRALRAADQGRTPRMAGNPVISETIEVNNTRDTNLFSGLMMLLVGVSTLLLLRRFLPALLPGAVVLVAVGWTMGLFIAAGHQTNWVTSIIAPILMLVGVADAVHFLARYQQALPHCATRKAAVQETLEAITLPCLFTSLTTAAGFASLLVNDVVPVRTFGTFAALGVMLALLASLAVLPALLSFGTPRANAKPPAEGRYAALLVAMDERVRSRPRLVLLVSLGVLVPLTAGAAFIQVETNLLRYFQDDAPIVRDSTFIEQAWGGCSPLDIVIDAGEPEAALTPETLKAVAALHDRLEAIEGVDRGESMADLISELYATMSGDPTLQRIPDSGAAIAQLLLMVDPETTDPLMDSDRQVLRLSTRFQGATLGVQQARVIIEQVEGALEDLFPEGTSTRLTGSSLLFMNMDEYLVNGQIRSMGLVLLVLLVAMVLLFRSPRMGLLAMIPNVVPIAAMLGLMGWLEIRLDGFTVMIACIAIGIGVDDTIHYLHHLRQELSTGKGLAQAQADTVRSVGRALVFTSVVLALGFWIFCMSDFVGTSNFGLLTGVTVLVALAADLLILPAMIVLVGVPRSWLAASAR